MKEGIKRAMQQDGQGNHFSNLLESQSTELCRLRQLLDEHEKREKQCQRKWNMLLKENLQLQQKANLDSQQITRQREQFQQIIVNSERKLIEANKRLAWTQQQQDKRAAAEYLVEQTRQGQEERKTLIADNQQLAIQVQDLLFESEKMKEDMKLFNMSRETIQTDDPNTVALINTQKLIQRIEELEDLVQDLKNKYSAQESVELKAIVKNQSQQLRLQQSKLAELTKKRCQVKDLFGQNDLYLTFQKLISERDEMIKALVINVQ